MTLTLHIIEQPPGVVQQEATHSVDRHRVVIGRSAESDWTLADPEKELSRKHCIIEFRNNAYHVIDISANGVYINQSEERLGRGNSYQLSDGDELILSRYRIQARLAQHTHATDVGSTAILPPGFIDSPMEPAAELPPQPSGRSAAAMAELEDLLNSADAPTSATPASGKSERDETEFDRPSSRNKGQPPVDDLFGDDLAGAGSGTGDYAESADFSMNDFFESEPKEPRLPSERGRSGKPYEETTAVSPIMPDMDGNAKRSSGDSARTPGRSTPSGSDSFGQRPESFSRFSGGDEERLLRAFLKGAQLEDLPIKDSDAEEFMNTVGQMFYHSLRGAMDVLMARGNFKSIVGVEKTMIRPLSNNPLKLFPPSAVREALKNLLGRSSPAYLPPVEAVREGFDDIRIHHLAVMAGTQAALTQLLEQFDPKQLERQFPKPSLWDRLIPGRGKSRHWAHYEDLYDELAERVKDDFSKALKNFAAAYEEQERSREQPPRR